MEQSPVLIVDDDTDDLELIEAVVKHLNFKRPVHYFRSGDELIEYMQSASQSPFLIFCDVNLGAETGFDIKKRIADHQELKFKSVPFIFWSTSASEKQIQQAYDLPAQGFFVKPSNFLELCDTFDTAIRYWQKSQHPKKIA